MKIIVDTNILIDFSRRKKVPKGRLVWPKLVSFAKGGGHQLILPSIAIFEFFAGSEMANVVNQQKAENLLTDVIVLDLDKEVAKEGAGLFRQYQAEIGPIDYLLAATAIVLEGELATLNPKHFKIFKNLHLFDLTKLV